MLNPKETFNHIFHNKKQDNPQPKEAGTDGGNPYTVESDQLAVPEVHTKDHEEKLIKREEEQNQSNKKEDVVFDTRAVPEIHIKK